MEQTLAVSFETELVSQDLDNNEQTIRLLLHTHRGGSWGYFWKKDGKETIWWPAETPLQIPVGAVDLYFGVHPSDISKDKKHRSKIGDIVAVNAIFLDIDAKDFDHDKGKALAHVQSLPIASVIIDSGGGYQVYYLFDQPFLIGSSEDRERIRQLQSDWVSFAHADKGAKDIARVLRVPGTLNGKYSPSREVKFIWADFSRLYRVSELREMVPLVKRPQKVTGNEELLEGLPVRLNRRPIPALVESLFKRLKYAKKGGKVFKEKKNGKEVYYPSRSEAEAGIVMILILLGWDYAEIACEFSIHKPSHFREEASPSSYLLQTYRKCITALAQEGVRPEIGKAYLVAQTMPWVGRPGGYNRAVMMALLAKAYQFNRWTVSISVREISEHGAVSTGGASIALKRLSQMGYLIKIHGNSDNQDDHDVDQPKGKKTQQTGCFDLSPFFQMISSMNINHPSQEPSDYCSTYIRACHTWRDAELWTENRFGKTGQMVYDALTEEVQGIDVIARITGKALRTVENALNSLEHCGLARYIAGGWVTGKRSLDEVAIQYNTMKVAEDRRQKHIDDRKARYPMPAGGPK